MNFEFSPDEQMMIETFARFFDEHSSPARVRAAQSEGFDRNLWQSMADLGAFSVRVPKAADGLDLGLQICAALAEEAGRTLVSVPFIEAVCAASLLGAIGGAAASRLLDDLVSGRRLIMIALNDVAEAAVQWVVGGSVADHVIFRRGNALFLHSPQGHPPLPANLASVSAIQMDLSAEPHILLTEDPEAIHAWEAAREQWKLLTGAALTGLAREAIRQAALYASQRRQFDQLIGSFQSISHPLADASVAVDAARLAIIGAIDSISLQDADAAAKISMSLWLACDASSSAVAQALHTFGGYGLTIDYDIHLYNLRAKAWALASGDPVALLEEAGRRLFLGEQTSLPIAGQSAINLDFGEEAKALAAETRTFFNANLTAELKAKAHYSHEGHDAEFHRKIAGERLLFPDWPVELGGRGATAYAAHAAKLVWDAFNWTTHPQGTANMVGHVMRRFGSAELKAGPLAEVAAGTATCALGFSEPSSGSDVFAATTKAIPDPAGWRISGQKMFTSGAEQADYVLLLARTDASGAKHRGLTMFIVPLRASGVEIAPVHTMQDERTAVTYYSEVIVADSYRLGDVGAGALVLGSALEIEHGVSFVPYSRRMMANAEAVARKAGPEGPARLDRPDCQSRLARVAAHIHAGTMLGLRSLWANVEGKPDRAFGSSTKLYTSETYKADACDLLDMLAPHSLLKHGPAAIVNECYRHSQVATTYAGTSEVHRSIIAERQLGLPRTRA